MKMCYSPNLAALSTAAGRTFNGVRKFCTLRRKSLSVEIGSKKAYVSSV